MKRILIIEDDPVAGSVYARYLQSRGFTTELVTDGMRGLEQLHVTPPDAVLLDLIMPKMGGIEVLKQLRAQEAFRALPVVVMTNAAIPAFVDQAINAGANRVLDKAKSTPEEIVEALQTTVGSDPSV
jgi:CheY-like chemotaxis protein